MLKLKEDSKEVMERGEKKQKDKWKGKYQFHNSIKKMSGTWANSGKVWAIKVKFRFK